MCVSGRNIGSFVHDGIGASRFQRFGGMDNRWVEKAFKGLRPAVVALIAVPCLTTARSIKMSYKELIIPIATALLIWQGGVSPVWIILAAIIGGLVYGLKIKKD